MPFLFPHTRVVSVGKILLAMNISTSGFDRQFKSYEICEKLVYARFQA